MKLDKSKLSGTSGPITVTIDTPDDLWALYCVVSKGDLATMKSMRKVKISEDRVIQKPMWLTLALEKISFDGSLPSVKLLGSIFEGNDDVGKGTHHSFIVTQGNTLTVEKQWQSFELAKLNDAVQSTVPNIVLVACERDQGVIAQLTRQGFSVLQTITGDVAGKYQGSSGKDSLFADVALACKELHKQKAFVGALVGSPSFWHTQLKALFAEHLSGVHVGLATITQGTEAGLHELLRRPEAKSMLAAQRAMKEIALVDELLVALEKEQPVVYGLADSAQSAQEGAVKELLVSEELLLKKKQEDAFDEIAELLRSVEQSRGEVHLIGHHAGGKKLDGLGGVAGLLRW